MGKAHRRGGPSSFFLSPSPPPPLCGGSRRELLVTKTAPIHCEAATATRCSAASPLSLFFFFSFSPFPSRNMPEREGGFAYKIKIGPCRSVFFPPPSSFSPPDMPRRTISDLPFHFPIGLRGAYEVTHRTPRSSSFFLPCSLHMGAGRSINARQRITCEELKGTKTVWSIPLPFLLLPLPSPSLLSIPEYLGSLNGGWRGPLRFSAQKYRWRHGRAGGHSFFFFSSPFFSFLLFPRPPLYFFLCLRGHDRPVQNATGTSLLRGQRENEHQRSTRSTTCLLPLSLPFSFSLSSPLLAPRHDARRLISPRLKPH